ncbi:MAG: PfkB family carbohydrate kinase [Actinomycetota bacterium]|nr:PfkB family carbohydrate kinase [Actinomycetota bacterium]
MILAVSLSPSVDRTLMVPDVELGKIHRPITVIEVAGGKGFNVARCLMRLDYPVLAIGILGGPTGQWIRELARSEGMNILDIPGSRNTRICTSIVDTSNAVLTEFYEAATSVTRQEWDQLCVEVRHWARTASWVTISGALPAGLSTDSMWQLIEAAREGGARVAIDTHGASLQMAVRARPAVIKVNRHEAVALLELADNTAASEVCERLAAVVGATAVVTDGESGAWTFGDDQRTLHVNSARRGDFPVGSGDCFLAGFVGALSDSQPVGEALRLASAAATANAQVPGPGIFDLQDVEAFLSETTTTTLEA